ncbi:MAG: hypothetical protein GF372_06080, partial [Candidatus Marinimicrobia bacterium]|nr:hypothetical protein [Candidatus Neomarinimicrobiota bacterium]
MRNFFMKFFVGLLSIPVLLSAQGQTGMIQGTIYEHSRMEPLGNVNVMLLDTQLGTVSNSNGRFTLHSVPTGEYTILLSHIGYSQVEKGV